MKRIISTLMAIVMAITAIPAASAKERTFKTRAEAKDYILEGLTKEQKQKAASYIHFIIQDVDGIGYTVKAEPYNFNIALSSSKNAQEFIDEHISERLKASLKAQGRELEVSPHGGEWTTIYMDYATLEEMRYYLTLDDVLLIYRDEDSMHPADTFPLGRILGAQQITIADALELLKYLANMDGIIKKCGKDSTAWDAALITPASQREGNPSIADVLEILKALAGMESLVVM